MEKFEKIFSPVNLLILNVIVIVAALATGSMFMDTGIVHGIAMFFIALSLVRIFVHYYSYDQFLEKFFHATLLTFLVFALSHFVEFFSYRVLHLYDDVTFINVINFYIVGLLILTIGTERFLRLYDNRGPKLMWILGIVAVAFVVPIIGFHFNRELGELESSEALFYIYIIISLVVAALAIWKVGRIGKLVSISSKFTKYIVWAIILVTVSIFIEIFYDLLKETMLQNYHIIYLSHFFFYGGMSLIFLAFGTLESIKRTGIYSEAERLRAQDIKN